MNKFVKKLRLIITIIVALFIAGCIKGIVDAIKAADVSTILMGTVILLVFIGLAFLIVFFWYGKDHQCPACKKRFCLKKLDKEIVDKENISVLMDTKTKSKDGNVIGSQEQYIPGERITYQVNYQCKKCGETCYRTYSTDVPKI